MEKFLSFMQNDLKNDKDILLSNLTKEETLIIFVDMVKGFYTDGSLANDKVGKIVSPMQELNNKTIGYKKLFFIDSHTEDSVEFDCYPAHCIEGTIEEELIEELKNDKFQNSDLITVIKKNSINGFHAKGVKEILEDEKIKNILVVGVCTDICVKTFVMTTITYFNEKNIRKNIIVPTNMVETFDADFHNRDFWNLVSLFEMKSNGVNIVRAIV